MAVEQNKIITANDIISLLDNLNFQWGSWKLTEDVNKNLVFTFSESADGSTSSDEEIIDGN